MLELGRFCLKDDYDLWLYTQGVSFQVDFLIMVNEATKFQEYVRIDLISN